MELLPFLRTHRARILGFLALSVLSLVVLRVTRRGRYETRVVFPEHAPMVTLAIRDPLVRPDLTVMATLRRSPKRGTAVWMTVDSGATGVTLPDTTYYSLGLDLLSGVRIRTEDARGNVLTRDAGLVPDMILGPLVLNDVVTAIGGNQHVLGQSILTHAPWEIDWDRGKLTLGAAAWPKDSEAIALPLRREGDSDVATVEIGGVPIDMVLDTGALASTIPESVGTRAGLDGRALAYPMVLHSAAGQILVRKVFLGELRLGALGIHPLELASMSSVGRRAPFGLLGLDVLSRFHVRVEPGVRLWLRPRRDLGITAAERLARWSFLPSCKRLGCLEASVEAVGEDAVVHVTYETDLARPLDVLFSCASNPGQPTAGTTLASDALVRAPRQLRLRVPAGFPGEPASVKVRRGGAWFGSGGAGCADLAVVDLSPASLEPRDAAVDDPAGGSVAAGELQVAFRP